MPPRCGLGGRVQGAPIVAAGTGEHNVVRRNQVGKLFDQPRKLLDLAGERRGCRQRFVEDCFDLALSRSEPAVEIRELARQIARAADKLGHLLVHHGALTLVGGDGTVDRGRRRQTECHQDRVSDGEPQAKIEHGAERGGDKHDADGNEDDADAHHADPVSLAQHHFPKRQSGLPGNVDFQDPKIDSFAEGISVHKPCAAASPAFA